MLSCWHLLELHSVLPPPPPSFHVHLCLFVLVAIDTADKENNATCQDSPGSDFVGIAKCRKRLFLKNLVPWMSEPKLPKAAADKWIDYWSRADTGLGEEVS